MIRGIERSRKVICVLLACVLIAVQAGCYTTQRVRSVNALAIPAYQEKELLRKGLLVRVFYHDGKSLTTVMGKLKMITSDEIIITTSENKDVPISLKYIQKINVYDKKFDVVLTVFTVAISGIIILWLSLPFAIGKALGDKFGNLNVDQENEIID